MTNAEEMVSLYLEAEKAVLNGKIFVLDGMNVTMENLRDIRAGRIEWERVVQGEKRRAAGQHGSARYQVAVFD